MVNGNKPYEKKKEVIKNVVVVDDMFFGKANASNKSFEGMRLEDILSQENYKTHVISASPESSRYLSDKGGNPDLLLDDIFAVKEKLTGRSLFIIDGNISPVFAGYFLTMDQRIKELIPEEFRKQKYELRRRLREIHLNLNIANPFMERLYSFPEDSRRKEEFISLVNSKTPFRLEEDCRREGVLICDKSYVQKGVSIHGYSEADGILFTYPNMTYIKDKKNPDLDSAFIHGTGEILAEDLREYFEKEIKEGITDVVVYTSDILGHHGSGFGAGYNLWRNNVEPREIVNSINRFLDNPHELHQFSPDMYVGRKLDEDVGEVLSPYAENIKKIVEDYNEKVADKV